ncbi:MAG TPA: right-handed parallel beta-helix repeat-containing protein, partial [Gemmatales bacterium]|nr:right-handed parallel beta-helix repeat-containing protein [Gemmatales bacterium]
AKQNQGKEGLLVNVGDFVIQNLTIEDTKSDALKIVGGKNVIIKQVRTRWTAGPLPTNGGYGIYPVQCSQVIIEECEAECASDAGIYVGQSEY